MNKAIAKILALILSLAVLTACSSANEPANEPSDYTPNSDGVVWDRDASEHWVNENGEKTSVGEHELEDGWTCTVCGSDIIDWGDGTIDVSNYDDNYNLLRSSSYDSEGNLITETVNEYAYDENGNASSSKSYTDGILTEEYEYTVDHDGNRIPVSSVYYDSTGEKVVSEYIGTGDTEKLLIYSAEGVLRYESHSEYAVSSDGWDYLCKTTDTDYIEGMTYISEFNENNDIIVHSEYDSAGNIILDEKYEYEYNDEGWKTYLKTTVNGLPSEEIYFGIYDDGEGGSWTYYAKHIVYNEDGSYTVSEHDENDEILTETSYDANGNIIG